ncbi:MAG: DUF1127 domain-containing protein [Sneathiellaceae bacterium]
MGPYYYSLVANRRQQEMMQAWNEANVAALVQRMTSLRRLAGGGLTALAAPLLWVARRRREAATVRELAALDDRLLSDIGLTRAAIRDAARRPQHYSRPPALQPGADVVALPVRPAPANTGSCLDASHPRTGDRSAA